MKTLSIALVWLCLLAACAASAAGREAGAFPPSAADVNLTPLALAQAERAPLGTDPALVVSGKGAWQNAGADDNKRVARPPVNESYPSWFILVWSGKQKLSAARLRSNAADYRLYAFAGDAKTNPAVAAPADWERIEVTELAKESRPGGGILRQILLGGDLEARAIKLLIREVQPRNSQIAWVAEFSVFGKATAGAMPAPDERPPFSIDCEVPVGGDAALVVNDTSGRRVRNLFAQVDRPPGKAAERWDLKNEDGRYVAPGTYQWKLIAGPAPELLYEMTPLPNVEMHSPDSRPWNGRPQDGWLANHGNQSAVCVLGKRLFVGAGGTEGGHALAECDLDGRKLWGSGQGVRMLFTDGTTLFMDTWGNNIARLDPETREQKNVVNIMSDVSRGGAVVGLAAKDDKIYAACYGEVPYMANATVGVNVDIGNCLPKLPASVPRGDNYGIPLSPQRDFISYFRLMGDFVGGDPRNTLCIESTKGKELRHFVVLAFKEPVPLGSLVLPKPNTADSEFRVSVLKPESPYPPRAGMENDWLPVQAGKLGVWNCVPLPERTLTRALRLTFAKPGADMLGDVDNVSAGKPAIDVDEEDAKDVLATTASQQWAGQVEGMRLLRMRLASLPPGSVRVSSGRYDGNTGEWDAERTEPLSPDDPAIFMMAWDKTQSVRGLAIKEIDGELTEIDAWAGDGPPELKGDAGWQKIAQYRQRRRNHYQPDGGNNAAALYIDGMVDFGRDVPARAIRLRVVKQWGEQPGRPEGVRRDRGGTTVDPARCRIYGLAALQYLGGEVPVDPIVVQRLSAFDGTTGKLLSERVSPITGAIAFRPADGALFGVVDGKVAKIDEKTLAAAPFVDDVKQPSLLAFSPDGRLYVYDSADDRRTVRVYDTARSETRGKYLQSIGKPGPFKPGPYDPASLSELCAMAADNENLWAVYPHDNPRRIAQFKQDGSFVQDFIGNTNYGGGGTLDPYDKTRFYWGDLRFRIDWETGTTQLDSIMTTKGREEASVWGWGFRHNIEPVVVNGRRYLVSSPLSLGARSSFAVVGVYDEQAKTLHLAAAVGSAGAFPYLQKPEFIKTVGGKPLGGFRFIWADRNGDAEPQVPEVAFTPLPPGGGQVAVGRFDTALGAWAHGAGGNLRYEVREFLPDGTPVYEAKQMPFWADYTLTDGTLFRFGPRGNEGLSPAGELLWSYRAGYGMDGLKVYPWQPGVVDLQFSISGMARVDKGDLGGIFVISANNGQMNLWTTDGLLAGHVTFHTRDPRARSFPPEHARGTKLENLTLGQEHFHHYFCKTADGRFYIVAGGTHASIAEVHGLEKFRRASGSFEVTKSMLDKTREWEATRRRHELFARAPIVDCPRGTRKIDGRIEDDEWAGAATAMGDFAEFRTAWDDTYLFLCWRVKSRGPLVNHGDDFRRWFKTGAAVDVQLGANPKAAPDRIRPVAGDLRLLITKAGDEPAAVLYRPIAPNAPKDRHWETTTPAGGTTAFDSVTLLKSARIRIGGSAEGYTVEAAVPLRNLGISVCPGSAIKMDWGVLTTDEGHITRGRQYWANTMATGVSDEPTEARLEPSLWGHLRFLGDTGEPSAEDPLQQQKTPETLDDLLDGKVE